MRISSITRRARRIRSDLIDASGWTASRFRRILTRAIVRDGPARHHVLIAPPGAGNIGDQAMVEAYVAAVRDLPTIVITRYVDDIVLPADLAEKAQIIALPSLLHGAGAEHRRDIRRVGALLAEAATLSIVGADIMDGVYSLRSSVRRSSIAAGAAAAGIDTTVLGFSWNAAAPGAAWRALKAAGASGARLLTRDPASSSRLRDAGVRGIVDTADIVFTDDRRDDAVAAEILRGVAGPFALVNVSGLIARSVDQVPEYAALLRELRRRGLFVVLVPHVLRSTADDLAACRAVADAASGDGVVLIERALAPSTIRALARRAELTVTGRMHLAIMSLAQGVPAITLATQGKVEGLMRLFEWPELCVTPRTGMAQELIRVARAALDDPSTSARIARGTERARTLAEANIERLAPSSRDAAAVASHSGGMHE